MGEQDGNWKIAGYLTVPKFEIFVENCCSIKIDMTISHVVLYGMLDF